MEKKIRRKIGVLVSAVGLVAIGAVFASGTAAGIMVESFKAARNAVKDTYNNANDADEEELNSEIDIV